jgi:hypothetical protein
MPSAETWDVVLDRLESDLAQVEGRLLEQHPPSLAALTAAQLGTWVPPSGLGPLPDRLIGRARDLAAAQARVAERLDALRLATVQTITALRAVPATRHTPEFVDVEG